MKKMMATSVRSASMYSLHRRSGPNMRTKTTTPLDDLPDMLGLYHRSLSMPRGGGVTCKRDAVWAPESGSVREAELLQERVVVPEQILLIHHQYRPPSVIRSVRKSTDC
jgi:hypothetical protein